jgi:hypothetical protein
MRQWIIHAPSKRLAGKTFCWETMLLCDISPEGPKKESVAL